MLATVPVVEITDDADSLGGRRPDRERNAFRAADLRNMRAEFIVDLLVTAFAEEMEINFSKRGRVGRNVTVTSQSSITPKASMIWSMVNASSSSTR
jgi:hypothetical protein